MNLKLKASTFCSFFSIFGLLLQVSCADTRWPSWLSGEPSREVLEAPRVVGTPPSASDKSFPNLSTVPSSKPGNFSTSQDRQQYIDKMLSDKEKAEKAKERIENIPIELPPGATGSEAEP